MSETDTDLPKTLIKRIVKRHLNQLDKSDTKRDTQINKDALLAFSESAKVFINYITATANDICKENKRQTISIDDIFKALEDTDFLELPVPLKQSLEVFKKDTREKNQKKAEAKKRKAEHQLEVEQQRFSEQQPLEDGMDAEPAVADQDPAQLASELDAQQGAPAQPQATQHAQYQAAGTEQPPAIMMEAAQGLAAQAEGAPGLVAQAEHAHDASTEGQQPAAAAAQQPEQMDTS